jgi:hypothetical protein
MDTYDRPCVAPASLLPLLGTGIGMPPTPV